MADEIKDTGPLAPEDLSDDEIRLFNGIEERLNQVRSTNSRNRRPLPRNYLHLAYAEDRYPRVLLLDGGRGTGKTSLMLTLVRRWNPLPDQERTALNQAYEQRFLKLWGGKQPYDLATARCPDFVRALRILDFDPLPPGMPLFAGIVQAWRPLVDEYERVSSTIPCRGETAPPKTLLDRWYQLFRMAAIGWTEIPHEGGIIQQVLDREDQVGDWQALGKQWSEFIDSVIEFGNAHMNECHLSADPVFVLMIDDMDLQVERARELLPALRMLYHPAVVFLVAGDRKHLIDMLALDFFGRQNKIANCQLGEDALLAADRDRWAGELAQSSFQKVFPIRNRWNLRRLTMREVLEFTDDTKTTNLRTVLNSWLQKRSEPPHFGSLGDYLHSMGGAAEDLGELVSIMPIRTAHQIGQRVFGQDASEDHALEAIRQIIGGTDSDDLIRVPRWNNHDTSKSETHDGNHASGKIRNSYDSKIEYLDTGTLYSLYPKEFTEEVLSDAEIVLSAHSHFVYRQDLPLSEGPAIAGSTENAAKKARALIAVSLRDDGYGVGARGLRWDVRLALAWTRIRLFDLDYPELPHELAFQWRPHEHPSPMRLLSWTAKWRSFVADLPQKTEDRLDRIAYAWIYHQINWMSKDGIFKQMDGLPGPFDENFNSPESWALLLSKVPETGTDLEKARWKTRSLPLLARPELGLTVDVQVRLLAEVKKPLDIAYLKDQRRRLVTDAILAAADEVGALAKDAENEEKAEQAIKVFEKRHQAAHGKTSPWSTTVEVAEQARGNSGNG